MHKEIIGLCDIYLGDALEIIPAIGKVDCIVSDPPYLLTSGGKGGELGGCLSTKNYSNNGSIVECNIDWSDFMPLLSGALDQGDAYLMANNRNVQAMLNAAEAAGFDFHNLLVWDKVAATANRWYMKNCEFTGYFYKGKAKLINDCSAKQLIRCPQVDESIHPTEKPVALMMHYIKNSTKIGEVVLDPFAGSGTTGVAALRLGRRCIMIEKSREYFDICCKRVQDADRQHDLFTAAPKHVRVKRTKGSPA